LTSPSVRNLLDEVPLINGTLLGGSGGVDAVPRDVVAVSGGLTTHIVREAVVVVGSIEGHLLEILLRRVYDLGARMVISCSDGPARHLSSTRVLADRLQLPFVLVEGADPLSVACQLWLRLHAAEAGQGMALAQIAKRLQSSSSPATIVQVLNRELTATCALLGAENAVLAGSEPLRQLPLLVRDGASTFRDERGFACVVPIRVGPREAPRLWMTAETGDISDNQAATVEAALTIASYAIAAWAATERLESQRDSTFQSTVLAELLAAGAVIPAQILGQAVAAGWQLEGWHTGVHLLAPASTAPGPDGAQTSEISKALAANKLNGPLVERGDGWSFWVTETSEATPERIRDLVGKLDRFLVGMEQVNLVAGVGSPRLGAAGLAETLTEARELSRFAGLTRGRQRIEHADEMGIRRLLAATASEDVRARSRRLLASLLVPENADLVRTLETYLDLESSTTSASARLGVHRNTVVKRLARIEKLLGVNLGDPEVRLALHIACRTR
jgi:purine catabolism regulator